MSLADRMAEGRRGVILDLLHRDPGYRQSDDTLRISIRVLGRGSVLTSVVQADLLWLEQHGLVRIEREPIGDGTDAWVGILTRTGREVAEGAPHPGVTRPDPR